MLKWLLALACFGARQAAAFGGTSEPWLGGTQPWDTVPFLEANVGVQASGGQGGAVGPFAQIGLLDQVMLSGSWSFPTDGSSGRGDALLMAREASFPTWRPALALGIRGERDPKGVEQVAFEYQTVMLIASIEPWDQSLSVNYEPWGYYPLFRLGYWSPYVLSFVRLGFEAQTDSRFERAWTYLPQVTFQAPGDLSVVAGASTTSQDPSLWSWGLHLSYQLFPSP